MELDGGLHGVPDNVGGPRQTSTGAAMVFKITNSNKSFSPLTGECSEGLGAF